MNEDRTSNAFMPIQGAIAENNLDANGRRGVKFQTYSCRPIPK
jgi:hypothetical protein